MTMEKDLFQDLLPSLPSGPQPGGEKEETAEKAHVQSVFENTTLKEPREERAEAAEGEGERPEEGELKQPFKGTRTFSYKIPEGALPPLLSDARQTQRDVEGQDSILLGSLTILSGAMPNVFGVYGNRRVYPPIYCLLEAPPASNKGMLNACRYLVEPIEKDIQLLNQQQQEDYQRRLTEFQALDAATRRVTPPPKEPPFRSLWIPANSTVSAVYQALNDNEEWGITFETEADSMSTVLQSEYGNYSDLLRKAYHHEQCSLRRRKDNEFIFVTEPRWAVLLTCTPGQVAVLIPSTENGLGSRFGYYHIHSKLVWLNVFERSEKTIDEQFLEFGKRYKGIYDELLARKETPIEIMLTEGQQKQFNTYFEALQLEQVGLYGDELVAFVRRLGLLCFRITMVLTVLRQEGCHPIISPLSQTMVCSDTDFQTAMTIVNCLINHTAHVYTNLIPHSGQSSSNTAMSTNEKRLLQALPQEFTTEQARQTAEQLGITWKTAERYLGKFVSKYHCTNRITNGQYRKV